MAKSSFEWAKESNIVRCTHDDRTKAYTLFLGRQRKESTGRYTEEIRFDEEDELSEEDILYLVDHVCSTPDGKEAYNKLQNWLFDHMETIKFKES